MAQDTFKSVPHLVEQLLGTVGSQPVSVTTPTIGAPAASASLLATATATVTGAKVGDLVFAQPLAALPANQVFVNAYVSATDTVTFVFAAVGGAVTGAARNFHAAVLHRS